MEGGIIRREGVGGFKDYCYIRVERDGGIMLLKIFLIS